MKLKSENTILKFSVLMSSLTKKDLMEIGDDLVESGMDDLVDGGFWIREINSEREFYSPKYRSVLGFEGEHDFPSNSSSWQKSMALADVRRTLKAYEDILSSEENKPYELLVRHITKNGKDTIYFTCSGTLLKIKGEYKYLIGTHKIEEECFSN